MRKRFFWSSYQRKSGLSFGRPRSKRPFEYSREEAVQLRQRVFLGVALAIFLFIFYLWFYSEHFRIKQINISGNLGEVSQEEIKGIIEETLKKHSVFLLPGDNYFLMRTKPIERAFTQKNILAEVEIKKDFPNALNVKVKEKLGRMIWVVGEELYLLELDGKITTRLEARDLVNIGVPVIYDLSNTAFDLNQPVVNPKLVNLIAEIYTDFAGFELPVVELDYFKLDSPQANYVKIVTKRGFEIHVNYLSSLTEQLDKLKKSLLFGKIDLNKINYINLRVANQVIYK